MQPRKTRGKQAMRDGEMKSGRRRACKEDYRPTSEKRWRDGEWVDRSLQPRKTRGEQATREREMRSGRRGACKKD